MRIDECQIAAKYSKTKSYKNKTHNKIQKKNPEKFIMDIKFQPYARVFEYHKNITNKIKTPEIKILNERIYLLINLSRK